MSDELDSVDEADAELPSLGDEPQALKVNIRKEHVQMVLFTEISNVYANVRKIRALVLPDNDCRGDFQADQAHELRRACGNRGVNLGCHMYGMREQFECTSFCDGLPNCVAKMSKSIRNFFQEWCLKVEPLGAGTGEAMNSQEMSGTQGEDDDALARAVVTTVRLQRDGTKLRQPAKPTKTDSVPSRIGRFVIVRRIGSGGMGVVYSAYDEELDRKVAIKVLHAESGGSSGRARIMREAQALARLSHPNIVHVYEVGELDNGQVFMAMEFCEGMTMDAWVHASSRSFREILAVYLQAAEGLAAAHEIGLVHRDIKPENMLIDARGRVVLLDFGLARMRGDASDRPTQEPDGAEASIDLADIASVSAEVIARTLTATGSIMGTPAYMSPEQCAGLTVDARSDQFSFCVSLYESLYGERPFSGRNLSDMIVAICQGEVREPPRGSSIPTWLRRVIVRGLSVKRSERWPSMQALATALKRDVKGARQRWFGAAGVAASLLVGMVGVWQPWSGPQMCAGAQQRLEGVWDGARKQEVAQALSDTGFAYGEQTWALVEQRLDRYIDGWARTYADACEIHQRGETSNELYDRQVTCLDTRLTEVQALVDILKGADATILQQTPQMLAGLAPVSACADKEFLLEGYEPPPNHKTAEAVHSLRAELVRVKMWAESGHPEKVVDAIEGVVEAAKTLGYRPLLAEAQLRLGHVRMALMQEKETEEAFLNAFLTGDAVRHDRVAAEAGAWLVFLNARRGRDVEAKLRAEHVSSVISRYGRTSVADANLHRGLATIDFYAGRFTEARSGLAHARQIAESLPEGQGELLATRIYVNIGQVCEYQGDPECMSQNYEQAMDRVRNWLGADDPALSMYRFMLAKARLHQARYDEAKKLVEASLAATKRTFGEHHHLYARDLNFAAEVAMLRGDFEAAQEYILVARRVAEKVVDTSNPIYTWSTMLGAKIFNASGDYEQALALAKQSIEHAKDTRGRDEHDEYKANKMLLIHANALLGLEQHTTAIKAFEKFLSESDRVEVSAKLHRTSAFVGLARAYTATGADEKAQQMLAKADELVAQMGDNHWAWAGPLEARAELALEQGRVDEAVDAAQRMIELLERSGCSKIDLPRARFLLARAVVLRDHRRAQELARRALAESDDIIGGDPRVRERIETWLQEHSCSWTA